MFIGRTVQAYDPGAVARARQRLVAPFLDPFAGLDPVARELHETRVMAERATYLLQRMPLILQSQMQLIALDLVGLPETQTVVAATTQFAVATERFAAATAGYPEALRIEREAAIVQLDRAVDEQRRAALTDLDRAVGEQRRAAVADLERAVDAQRRATVADLDAQQAHARELLVELRSTLDRAEQAGLSVNAATSQTIAGAEARARRTLVLAFGLALALLVCAVVGMPVSALLYRRIVKPSRPGLAGT